MKNLLKKYTAFIGKLLLPLGPWGVFAIAAIDSAAFGLPMDAVIAGYVFQKPSWFLVYPLMGAVGSALGSLIIYAIGRKGGEMALRKKISHARFERIAERFERQEFFALMIPSMLPPPTPFKLFIFAAGALEMKVRDFLLAIFAGRFIRFLILAVLVVKFGPKVLDTIPMLFHQHRELKILVGVGVVLIALLLYFLLRKPVSELAEGGEE